MSETQTDIEFYEHARHYLACHVIAGICEVGYPLAIRVLSERYGILWKPRDGFETILEIRITDCRRPRLTTTAKE
jgi:hypothetical protein